MKMLSERGKRKTATREQYPRGKRGRPRGTGTDTVYQSIRAQILNLTLKPGSDLDENQLVRQFKMSRTPVREALIRLSSEGLIKLMPNIGARVASLTANEVPQLLEALELAQRATTRWAAVRRRPDDLERFAQAANSLPRRCNCKITIKWRTPIMRSIWRSLTPRIIRCWRAFMNYCNARLYGWPDCLFRSADQRPRLPLVLRRGRPPAPRNDAGDRRSRRRAGRSDRFSAHGAFPQSYRSASQPKPCVRSNNHRRAYCAAENVLGF